MHKLTYKIKYDCKSCSMSYWLYENEHNCETHYILNDYECDNCYQMDVLSNLERINNE